jgi:hypothetical protein
MLARVLLMLRVESTPDLSAQPWILESMWGLMVTISPRF